MLRKSKRIEREVDKEKRKRGEIRKGDGECQSYFSSFFAPKESIGLVGQLVQETDMRNT